MEPVAVTEKTITTEEIGDWSHSGNVPAQWVGESSEQDEESVCPAVRTAAHGLVGALMEGAEAEGATINVATGAEPVEGYAVTVWNGPITPDDQFFSGPPGEEAGQEIIADWLRRIHAGIWPDEDNNEIVLDVTEVVADRDEAIKLGVQRDQQFIYDLARGEPIPTGGTGGRQQEALGSRKPSKPVSQMTEAERKALAAELIGLGLALLDSCVKTYP